MEKSLNFLRLIKEHNDREWFEENKDIYKAAFAEFSDFITSIMPSVKQQDTVLSYLEPKDAVFRIYRDVRFSRDKSPYKIHFAAYFSVGGRKSELPGYYLHIQPGGGSFIAGGVWMPQPPVLKRIREEIDYNGDDLAEILSEEEFASNFPEISGDRLQTVPKGFPKDHKHLNLLQLKSFIVEKKFSDEEVLAPDFGEKCIDNIRIMQPFCSWLRLAFD
jgi:uncharacterized protein (TIGR02453 family)